MPTFVSFVVEAAVDPRGFGQYRFRAAAGFHGGRERPDYWRGVLRRRESACHNLDKL